MIAEKQGTVHLLLLQCISQPLSANILQMIVTTLPLGEARQMLNLGTLPRDNFLQDKAKTRTARLVLTS